MTAEQQLYSNMLKIRKFEQKVVRLYADGELPGFVHLYIGEEAIAVGVCSNLNDDDFITSTHRGHGHLIAKGGDVKLMMAELMGKKTGYCKGKGGSMHIADLNIGILGANGIVGGGLPMAVGAGYSAKLRQTKQVTVAFFGDGASNEGTFHESLNMAAAWKLPVVFMCENNKFGVSTRIDRVTNTKNIADRAKAYDIPGINVEGNDVEAVARISGEAISRARAGEGPTLIVADTFRHRGHFEGEVVNYWKKEELNAWKEKDPIMRYGDKLVADGKATQEELEVLERDIATQIEEAVTFARESAFPEPEDALDDLFWTEGGCA